MSGGFYCACPAPFYGETCELAPASKPKAGLDLELNQDLEPKFKDFAECPTHGPSSCEQLCTASEFRFICSCLPGFRLQSDGRTCEPEVEFPCGQVPDQLQSNSSDSLCTNKHCPWQVSLLNRRGVELCKGALLGLRTILTSANCLQSHIGPELDPNQIFIRFSGQPRVFQVRSVEVHERFSSAHDYDLALLQVSRPPRMSSAHFHLCVPAHRDHAENVLMHDGKALLVGGYGSGARSVSLEECRGKNISHSLTNKMFCLETRTNTELEQAWTRDRTRDQTKDENREQIKDQTRDQNRDRARDQDRASDQGQRRPEQSRGVKKERAKRETDGKQNAGTGEEQNIRLSILNEQHQTDPDLGQTKTRGQDQGPDPQRENKGLVIRGETQNGHHQGQTDTTLNREMRNQTKTRPDNDKLKVHPHQDLPGLNQTLHGLNQDTHNLPKPTQTKLNSNKQKDHSQENLNKPDQGRLNSTGLNQDQSRVQGLLQGTPVVSVDRGTAYLVGLLTSTAPGRSSTEGGSSHILVLTKLSRHMTWLQQRLGHMTPQVTKLPQP
ncbi:uncharacterized protein LOC129412423 isoform X2 [Boleophthalmus pectinirostris]|nr:uncharacterized protein LOC129412423 isoform X2 [Boleophthalmus pectinirostris]